MSENPSDEDDPLEELYEDGNEINRKRLAEALQGIITVDRETGDPIYKSGYKSLSNKEKFLAQLLFRRAALALGEIDEEKLGIRSSEAAENVSSSASAVQNYVSDLDFVKTDDDLGGYILPGYALEEAIEFITD